MFPQNKLSMESFGDLETWKKLSKNKTKKKKTFLNIMF